MVVPLRLLLVVVGDENGVIVVMVLARLAK